MSKVCKLCGHGVGAHHALGCLRHGCNCPGFQPKEPPAPVKETARSLFEDKSVGKEEKRYPD